MQRCLYDKQHQRRSQAALARPGGDAYFCDLIVSDSVAWIGSSTSIRSGDGAGFEYYARLAPLSGSDTSSVVLNRWKALEPVRMMLAYSGKDRSLRLAMHAETDSQARRYGQLYTETQLASVDAGDLRVAYLQPVSFEPVRVYRGNAFGLSLPFTGIPTDIFVDGAERMELFCWEYGGGMTYDLAVLQFDASGKPGAAFSARRANPIPGNASVGRLRRGELELLKGKIGEMAFDDIRKAEDRVILYNDYPDNVTRNQRAVPKILQHPPKARTTANSARRGRWHLFETGGP